jgi:hypothetical protein
MPSKSPPTTHIHNHNASSTCDAHTPTRTYASIECKICNQNNKCNNKLLLGTKVRFDVFKLILAFVKRICNASKKQLTLREFDVGHLDNKVMWACKSVPTFRRNTLSLFSRLQLWRWKRSVSLKCWCASTSPHGVISREDQQWYLHRSKNHKISNSTWNMKFLRR